MPLAIAGLVAGTLLCCLCIFLLGRISGRREAEERCSRAAEAAIWGMYRDVTKAQIEAGRQRRRGVNLPFGR